MIPAPRPTVWLGKWSALFLLAEGGEELSLQTVQSCLGNKIMLALLGGFVVLGSKC